MSFNKDHRAAAEQHLSAANVYYAHAADADPADRATALNHAGRGVTLSRARSLLSIAESVETLAALLSAVVTHPPEWAGVEDHGPVEHHGWPVFADREEARAYAEANGRFVHVVHCTCGCGDVAWAVTQ